ncbi:ABC-three component system protein [Paracoccus denitrificans]|uniref:ABC-three component system protein n=1 Tax=Paracoccus denitrificans TaxID=266 RepID=UPI002ED97F14
MVVVSRDSADPGVAGATPVSVDKDHINICKPPNRDDIVFRGIRRHIKKVVDTCPAGQVFGIDSYTEPSDSDRRDLLQKLIDAGREHEYNHANNAQNRFARRYFRTGLLVAAREDHDNFLSEIETRFVTHVFHPLICFEAPDAEVRAALQNHVIQPLTNKKIGGTKFDASSVLNGLYYLTEQCHIRWDPPT